MPKKGNQVEENLKLAKAACEWVLEKTHAKSANWDQYLNTLSKSEMMSSNWLRGRKDRSSYETCISIMLKKGKDAKYVTNFCKPLLNNLDRCVFSTRYDSLLITDEAKRKKKRRLTRIEEMQIAAQQANKYSCGNCDEMADIALRDKHASRRLQ